MTQIHKRDEINDFAKLVTDWRSMAIIHAVYEHGSLRYASLDRLLGFSPAVLSQKLAKLTESGIIIRRKIEGAKEVLYLPTNIAKDVVCAYHILEGVSTRLAKVHCIAVNASACKIYGEREVK